jgi:hypothetical protein
MRACFHLRLTGQGSDPLLGVGIRTRFSNIAQQVCLELTLERRCPECINEDFQYLQLYLDQAGTDTQQHGLILIAFFL